MGSGEVSPVHSAERFQYGGGLDHAVLLHVLHEVVVAASWLHLLSPTM